MTPELRNLPHIASMAFNEPLLLEPAYARVFFCALAGQLGITRLTDTVSGVTLGAEQMAEPLTLFGDDEEMGPKPARSYQITDGIAVLPVSGTLVSKTRSLQPYSGMTGCWGLCFCMLVQRLVGSQSFSLLMWERVASTKALEHE